jgi:hypothetical protein
MGCPPWRLECAGGFASGLGVLRDFDEMLRDAPAGIIDTRGSGFCPIRDRTSRQSRTRQDTHCHVHAEFCSRPSESQLGGCRRTAFSPPAGFPCVCIRPSLSKRRMETPTISGFIWSSPRRSSKIQSGCSKRANGIGVTLGRLTQLYFRRMPRFCLCVRVQRLQFCSSGRADRG